MKRRLKMKVENFLQPLRILLNYKIIIIFLVIISVFIGVPYYIKHTLEKYAKIHELEINIGSAHFDWRIWKIPGIKLKHINIKNKGLNPTFTHISANSIVLEPNYVDFFKSYMKDYNLLLKIKAFKVFLHNGSVIETNTLSSHLKYRNNLYKIHNFNLHPLKIKLDSQHNACIKNGKKETCEGQLIIYLIEGEGQYRSVERELEIYLKAPQASTQTLDGTAYSMQAKGKIKFLGLMPYQYGKNSEDPGIRGRITYTIDNFSNLLHQLNQAKFISNIAKNLGTIIGYPIPRVDPFTPQTEIFTNAISLDMTFKPDGTYLGPMKL